MPTPTANGVLHGLNILVVEDNAVQADVVRLCLLDAGAIVLGPVGKLEEAVELIALNCVDIAIVDIDLGDGPIFDVAGHLARAGVPFLFVTGYDCATLPKEFQHISCLEKPFTEDQLVRALISMGANSRV